MDVAFLLRRTVQDARAVDGGKMAVQLENGPSWTYEQLHTISDSYANALRKLGVGKGDRVGILLYNCLEYWAVYFAATKLGAIAVRLNFRLSSEELEYALQDSETHTLCFERAFLERLMSIRHSVPVKHYVCLAREGDIPEWCLPWDILENGQPVLSDPPRLSGRDPVMLMYTSGTTGRPKGALWTHDNTLWFTAIQALKWNLQPSDVCMTTGPLYHVGALEDVALPGLLVGAQVIITKSGGFDIRRVLNVVEQNRVTHVFLFPFMIYDMLNLPDLAPTNSNI